MNDSDFQNLLSKLVVEVRCILDEQSQIQLVGSTMIINVLIDLLRELSLRGNNERLAKIFSLKRMNGIIYGHKLTAKQVVKTILLITQRPPKQLLEDFMKYCLRDYTRESDVEWKRLDKYLDENEKMYLIYCAKKLKQIKL